MQVIKAILKVLLGLLVLLGLVLGAAVLALRVPAVQTSVARKTAAILSEKLGHEVTIGRVDVRPFTRVVLDQVHVLDRAGNELFHIGRTEADISVFSIFSPNKLYISKATLTEPRFALITYANQPDSTNLTQFIGAVKKLIGAPDTTATKKPFDFKIEAVDLRNARFVLDRQNVRKEPYYGKFMDYAHMDIDSIYANLSEIWFRGDTVHARIADMRAVDRPSKTRLRELSADMTYASKFWEFDQLDLHVGRSHLSNYLKFEYQHFLNFTDFNDSVKVTARLKPSRVYSDDIAQFAPQLEGWNEQVLISGEAKGYVRNFAAKNLDVRYSNGGTRIIGNISAEGLPEWKETFAELRLRPGTVLNPKDLQPILPASVYPYFQRLGTVQLNGQFLGFYNDFVANGDFRTKLGNLTSDVNLKFKNDARFSSYAGTVRTSNFQLGKLIGDESVVRDVAVNGRIQGQGFTPEGARARMTATIPHIWVKGYRYQNIQVTDGQLSKQSFDGNVRVNDPNLQVTGEGTISFGRQQAFDVVADVRRANLQALGILNRPVSISTQANVKFQGLTLDALLGRIHLRDTRLTVQNRTVQLDTLDLLATRRNGERLLAVRSDAFNLRAAGNFEFTRVISDVQQLADEYLLNFQGDAAATAAYYRRKRRQTVTDYSIALNLYLKRPNPLIHVFMPQLTVSDSTRIEGSFRNGNTSILNLSGTVARVQYDSIRADNAAFDLLTSKLPYSPEVLAQASVTSTRQRLPGLGATEQFYVEGVWDQDKINFSSSLAQTGTTNRAQINGALDFLPGAVQIVFRQSGVNLLGRDWTIAQDNAITIRGGGHEIDVQNFTLSNGAQQVSAVGQVSEDPSRTLHLQVKDLELATLTSLTRQNMTGRVNAVGDVRGVFGQLVASARLTVDSLFFDKVLIGNVTGVSDWDNRASRLGVNLNVERDRLNVLSVAGTIAPGAAQDQLNLTGVLNDAPIKLAEPFLAGVLKNLGGTGRGTLRLTGKFAAPSLRGEVAVRNGQLTFAYLNTVYTFEDRIRFFEDRMVFRNIRLRDVLGNSGTLDGSIYHEGFSNMRLALKANFRRMQVLNTTRRDNELYFGTAFATGEATVSGLTDNLVVNVRARSEAGTRLSLPLDNAATATQANYIRFVNRNPALQDTTAAVTGPVRPKVDLSGILLNCIFDVTQDAYMEVILDENTGDVIRGTAAGQLRLNIDTRGDFNMYGQLEIVRGAYNFTLQGLVNKEFQVRPGGTLTWNGSPLDGQMDVTATYTQRTPLAPILLQPTDGVTSTGYENATASVTAIMHLTGEMLLPRIQLGLEFNDAPSALEAELTSFLSSIRNDEQELNRQVFSLLLFRQLSTVGGFGNSALSGGGTVQNSLGQILSTQLGLLTSQINQNLEINFNLDGVTAEELQRLQVRLSYSLLEGRLRFTRQGGISNNAYNDNPTGAAQTSLVGDLSLEYFLRKDGRFRVRLRYETTPRDLGLQNQQRAGVSFVHTEQFDSLTELFARKRPRRREEAARKAREQLTIDDDPRTAL
ncbi:translocation/assembly module TamB domain-containing protein [Hymenobacter koreensis]|uniref:translocation/assembly module TamB domain-containing protein n=1 Tax=Hymenobacter koreensis TaxID=1084523 RepID=UPI0031ED6C0A